MGLVAEQSVDACGPICTIAVDHLFWTALENTGIDFLPFLLRGVDEAGEQAGGVVGGIAGECGGAINDGFGVLDPVLVINEDAKIGQSLKLIWILIDGSAHFQFRLMRPAQIPKGAGVHPVIARRRWIQLQDFHIGSLGELVESGVIVGITEHVPPERIVGSECDSLAKGSNGFVLSALFGIFRAKADESLGGTGIKLQSSLGGVFATLQVLRTTLDEICSLNEIKLSEQSVRVGEVVIERDRMQQRSLAALETLEARIEEILVEVKPSLEVIVVGVDIGSGELLDGF